MCPDNYGGRGRRGSGRLFPQIAASGAACGSLAKWATESRLMAQFDYNLWPGALQTDWKLFLPRLFSCPIKLAESAAVPRSKSWTCSLITIGPLFTLKKKNKSPQTQLSPLRLPAYSIHPQPCPPPPTASLEKESLVPPGFSVQVLQVSPSVYGHECLSWNTCSGMLIHECLQVSPSCLYSILS